MIEAAGLALAVSLGVDLRRVVWISLVVYFPVVAIFLVSLAYLAGRRRGGDGSAFFCSAVAAEMRAGASLRQAVGSAASSIGAPISQAQALTSPLPALARHVSRTFPSIGAELGVAIVGAARSGGRVSELFDQLAGLALAHDEIRHEVRVGTSAARATASILVLAPLAYFVWQAMSGALGRLWSAAEQRVVAVLGLLLFLAGLAASVVVVWRSR